MAIQCQRWTNATMDRAGPIPTDGRELAAALERLEANL